MTEAEFDKLIRHHEYQASLWGPETHAHKNHANWAAQLRAMKEEESEALQACRDFLHAVLPWKPRDYANRYFLKNAIAAGKAVIAKAEESK